jgi:teichuronic acid biosynthesis glycosyltransferase TuaC
MYPESECDSKGIFIKRMVDDLTARGVVVKKAVKTTSSPLGYIPFYTRALHVVRDREIDIIQAEYIPHSSLIPVFFRRKETPLVMKFHGDDGRIFPFKNRFNRKITEYMLAHADYVITASEEMKRILISIGADPTRISAIHTGVDTDFFSPVSKERCREKVGVPADAMVFIYIGRLHPWKGIYEIVEVAKICPEFRFIFVGSGSIPDHPPNCTFIGPVSPDAVRDWLNVADCLLLPTYTEGVPTVVMEAFACCLPVIATDVGGCPEIVSHQENGLFIPVRDERALFKAVHWMHEHPDERKIMGKRGRETVVQNYEHGLLVEKLMNIHLALVD